MNGIRKRLLVFIALCLGFPLSGHTADPFAGLPDPTRYKKTPKKVVKQVVRKPLILQSTLISDDRSYAIVNGKQVSIGERIEGARLLAINPYDIVIERRGREISLHLLKTGIVRKNGRSDP